uniref:Ig-like domain-containing protein n=1 Tax=Gadus morhua TaxID=8049 RepID=A0A8C5F9W2_GADMO
ISKRLCYKVLKMIILFHCSDPNAQRFVSQTVVRQPVSASAQLGDPVALQCSITSQRTDHSNPCQGEPSVYWFRSGPSHPAAIYMNGNRSGECQNSSGPSAPQSCVYTLPKNNVDSSDAGTYYCALAACGEVVFGNGTKLDITDPNDQRFVSQTVVQQPVSASAQLGDPVALQCSITSQRTDHSNQCQGEPSVYWFRSGSSQPAAIYMNGNRSGECQHSSGSGPPSAPQSCVYTLPKNNVDSSDAGTYYCALAACGEVVFGSGTKLDVGLFYDNDRQSSIHYPAYYTATSQNETIYLQCICYQHS